MAAATSWTSNSSGRTNAVCSCGAATCIRTSCTEANPGRRFLYCWINPPISCPRCERLIPSLLSTNKENAELKLLKQRKLLRRGLKFKDLIFCYLLFTFTLACTVTLSISQWLVTFMKR
ncbi:hypothetical protein Hanom_Chr05g00395311 [Helianthus anomalus]